MGWDGMGWDGMGWDGVGWGGVGWGGVGWGGVGWGGVGWGGVWGGVGWGGVGWGGVGWGGVGKSRKSDVCRINLPTPPPSRQDQPSNKSSGSHALCVEAGQSRLGGRFTKQTKAHEFS